MQYNKLAESGLIFGQIESQPTDGEKLKKDEDEPKRKRTLEDESEVQIIPPNEFPDINI